MELETIKNKITALESNVKEKQNEINEFFLEQISKIQKRKKIIFEMTIKDRDCFLKNKK